MPTNNSPNFLSANPLSLERLQDDDTPSGYDYNRIVDALTGLRNGTTTINANGSGVILSPTGLIAKNPAGFTTFNLDAATGSVAINVPFSTPPGQGTITVNDSVYNRVQIGNLADYVDPSGFDSPAMYGIRTLDAAGNTIFDSLGLINVMTSGGFAAGPSSQSVSTANSSTYVDITGSTFTFTITGRPQRILYMVLCTGTMTAGGGLGYVRGNIVGFDTSASIWFGNTAASLVTSNGFVWYFTGPGAAFPTVPIGMYTVKMQASTDALADTIKIQQFFHQIFVLGS